MSSKAVNLAGKPSRWGGIAARVFGWSILVVGLAGSLGVGMLFQSILPEYIIGYALGIPMALVTLFFGLAFVFGGRSLGRHGDEQERAVRYDSIRALAAHQGGAITAQAASRSLGITELAADTLLTELAKTPEENVCLELDDAGQIQYLFGLDSTRWRFDTAGIATAKAPEPNLQDKLDVLAEDAVSAETAASRRHP